MFAYEECEKLGWTEGHEWMELGIDEVRRRALIEREFSGSENIETFIASFSIQYKVIC